MCNLDFASIKQPSETPLCEVTDNLIVEINPIVSESDSGYYIQIKNFIEFYQNVREVLRKEDTFERRQVTISKSRAIHHNIQIYGVHNNMSKPVCSICEEIIENSYIFSRVNFDSVRLVGKRIKFKIYVCPNCIRKLKEIKEYILDEHTGCIVYSAFSD